MKSKDGVGRKRDQCGVVAGPCSPAIQRETLGGRLRALKKQNAQVGGLPERSVLEMPMLIGTKHGATS